MSDAAAPPMRDEDVVALVSEAIDAARDELRRSVAGSDDTGAEVQQPGITIDLGHRNIQHLPEEVIDIIKDEIER